MVAFSYCLRKAQFMLSGKSLSTSLVLVKLTTITVSGFDSPYG